MKKSNRYAGVVSKRESRPLGEKGYEACGAPQQVPRD